MVLLIDDSRLAAVTRSVLQFQDLPSLKASFPFPKELQFVPVAALAFSQASSLLAAGFWDGAVMLLDTSSCHPFRPIASGKGHPKRKSTSQALGWPRRSANQYS